MIKRGEVLLLSFPFTDLRSNKVRPALVVSSDSFNGTGQEAIFVFITSKEYSGPFDLRISGADPGFRNTGLKVPSTFRVSKLMCLEQGLVRKRLGYADKSILTKVDSALMLLLGFVAIPD